MPENENAAVWQREGAMNEAQTREMVRILESSKFFEAIKREFDRSFAISVSEKDGKVLIQVEEEDTGSTVMTVGDVAAFLQTDRATVRRMTRERSQRQSRFPIPFVKLGAKMLRFHRPAIEEWWKKQCEVENLGLSLPSKGKTKKAR